MPADPTPTIPHNPTPDPTPGSGPTPTFDPAQTAELAAPPAAMPASAVSTVPAGGGGAGTPVPGYDLLGELGRGGMGVVLRARHIALGRLVALKLMLGTRAAGRHELIRFLAEAEAVAAVRHPGVVQVYDYGEADGRPYMALELLTGGTLTDLIKQNERLEAIAAAEVVAKVARGGRGRSRGSHRPTSTDAGSHSEARGEFGDGLRYGLR